MLYSFGCNVPIRRSSGKRTSATLGTNPGRSPPIRRRGDRSPKSVLRDRRSSRQRLREQVRGLVHLTPTIGLIARQSFRRRFRSAPPGTNKPSLHCLAEDRPGSRRLLLGPHSHSTAFESPAHRARAPEGDPGRDRTSQVRFSLRSTRHVGSGLPHGSILARPPLPGRRSFRRASPARRFRGHEYRSVPLPTDDRFGPGSAPSRIELTGKPFPAFHG